MSQVYDKEGKAAPVTLIETGPCVVTQVKNEETDGYNAVQLGFLKLKKEKTGKSQSKKPYRFVKEVRGKFDVSPGDEVSTSIFSVGDKVKVRGVSKGKGFAGVVKRWGFSGSDASHGTKDTERRGGSIGSMFPQRVMKGKKMPGRMGTDKVTVRNLKVVDVNPEKNIIAVKGAVPGKNGGAVTVEKI